MRRALLLACLLLGLPYCYSQESNKQARIEKTKPTSVTSPNASQSELDAVNAKIKEYDKKISYYESHLEEKKVALENGTIAKLQQERDSLIKISIQHQKPIQTLSAGSKNTQLTKVEGADTETIEHIDSVIAAIDSKVAWTKQDQTENQKAIESGYYEMMEAQKAKLLEKRKQLVELQNTNK